MVERRMLICEQPTAQAKKGHDLGRADDSLLSLFSQSLTSSSPYYIEVDQFADLIWIVGRPSYIDTYAAALST